MIIIPNILQLFIFSFLTPCIFNQNGILILPFRKEVPNIGGVSPKDVIDPNLADNLVITELKIGTDPQTIKVRIELASYLFYITSGSMLSQTEFIPKNSDTYKKIENTTRYFRESKLTEGIFSSDIFYLNDNKYETNFILGVETLKDKSGGLIGLKIDDSSTKSYANFNFINEMKRNKIISDYYFTIKYNDNYSGNIIIGNLPHKYDSNYKEDDFKDIYSEFKDFDFTWKFKLDSIYIAEGKNSTKKQDLGGGNYAYLKIEKGIIEGTSGYRTTLLNYFMQEKIDKKLCFEVSKETDNNYISYYCKKEVDISQLKNIYFYNKELDFTFELTYKDLFYYNEIDGNYYFLVVFLNEYDEWDYSSIYWTFGEPLFKKYQFVFNQNSKRIGLYTSIGDNNNNNNINVNNETWWSRNKWYLVLIILLFIFFVSLAIMLFLYFKNKPKRKIKANELDEDFEYSSAKDQSENKLIN